MPAEDEPYRIGGDVLPPKRLERPPFDGLHEMLRSGRYVWASCIMTMIIDRDGKVAEMELLKPDAIAPEIRSILTGTLEKWRFEPATRHDQPVAVRYSLVIQHCPLWKRDDEPARESP